MKHTTVSRSRKNSRTVRSFPSGLTQLNLNRKIKIVWEFGIIKKGQ